MKRILPVAIIGVILGLLYGVYSARQGPAPAPRLSSLPPQEQEKRRESAQNLVAQVETIARDARRGTKKPFELRASQDQINTLLQDRFKAQNLPVEDLSVTLVPGQIQAGGTAKYNGFDVPVVLSATPQIEAGALKLNVDSLTLGGFPAPGEWKDKAQKAIGDGLEKLFQTKNAATLQSVEVENGTLVLRGQTG